MHRAFFFRREMPADVAAGWADVSGAQGGEP